MTSLTSGDMQIVSLFSGSLEEYVGEMTIGNATSNDMIFAAS